MCLASLLFVTLSLLTSLLSVTMSLPAPLLSVTLSSPCALPAPLLCRFYNVKKMQILQTLKKAEYSVAHTSPKLGQGIIRLPPMAFSENINDLFNQNYLFCFLIKLSKSLFLWTDKIHFCDQYAPAREAL